MPTITVTTTADQGTGSLREAIANALSTYMSEQQTPAEANTPERPACLDIIFGGVLY
jgi:hypothetical protein